MHMDRRNADIVLVRMDKIGDLVLTLPVDEHPALQGFRVHWFISTGMDFVTAQASPRRESSAYRRRFSFPALLRMVKWLRANQPRTIVLLHNPWWVSLAAWWAGVPERIGRRSQWHSFLFVNIPIRQKRSNSDRHESDFNFDLVEWAFNHVGVRASEDLDRLKRIHLRMIAPHPESTLEARNLKPRVYRVIHPGMAGSALNWPAEFYVDLITSLAKEMPVVITGTRMDAKYLEGLKHLREARGVNWLVEDLNVRELLDVLSQAKSVVAPSTGVLHLAAALGTPALGIYSPRKVEHPRRWGPRGANVGFELPQREDLPSYTSEIMREIPVGRVEQTLRALESNDARK
jgi:heptosyltransferase I